MTKIFSTVVMVLFVCFARAQDWPFELWHEGKVVLLSGDTLKGLVKYDLQQDLVQYTRHDKVAEVYTARKILFFEIFDTSIHKYRRFFVLPYSSKGGYKTPVFFELLAEGKITLFAREHLEYKSYNSPYYVGSYSRLVMSHKFFFLTNDGGIEEFTGSRHDLLHMMEKKSHDVEKYIKSHRLKLDDKFDLSRIVEYYNSLTGS